MQSVQARLGVLQTLRSTHVLQYHLFLLERKFACRSTFLENAEELQFVIAVLNRVNQGKGEFPFIEVFAKPFLLGILI